MRLWSLHPKYLDARGIVALWREGLLARKVLEGKTRGYKNHPQLERFKAHSTPLAAIDAYLWEVHAEATRRGYNFDGRKLGEKTRVKKITVTDGQIEYEALHLMNKLAEREPERHKAQETITDWTAHPLFKVAGGPVESWEVMKRRTRVHAYIVNKGRLLVFRHVDYPVAGIQVPAGSLEKGETPEEGILREVEEETGLKGCRILRRLGEFEHDMREFGMAELQTAIFFHLDCPGNPPEVWRHDEAFSGKPEPIRLEFFWAKLPDEVPELIALNGAMLHLLVASNHEPFF